jgi:hypothetical protein
MEPSQIVDSYKYWDIASLWSREALQHESVAGTPKPAAPRSNLG